MKQPLFDDVNVIAWKLFEVGYGVMPKTLVHGLPLGNQRTRYYPKGQLIQCEQGTPGFNVFETFTDLEEYLPRFRVRANRLVACEVRIDRFICPLSNKSKYFRAQWMIIPSEAWKNRLLGANILN